MNETIVCGTKKWDCGLLAAHTRATVMEQYSVEVVDRKHTTVEAPLQ